MREPLDRNPADTPLAAEAPGFGDPRLLALDRARAELRSGRPLHVTVGGHAWLVAALETLRPATHAALVGAVGAGLRLVTTAERARALGWPPAGAHVSARVAHEATLSGLRALAGAEAHAGSASAGIEGTPIAARPADVLAVALAKRARLLPTMLVGPAAAQAPAGVHALDAEACGFLADAPGEGAPRAAPALAVERIGEARVPLAEAEDARMVVYRDLADGVEHVAVLVGDVRPGDVVEARVHSACLTGDLFGSLRCDCGDQLRGAVRRFAALGGGVLLYIAQEGRGIGLANKLRAYRLQDDHGLDTIDADRHLGFEGDERRHEVAAQLLADLGCRRIRLHTNNPRKVEALSRAGVEVVDFRTLGGAQTPHNERYLHARRERAGHLTPDPE